MTRYTFGGDITHLVTTADPSLGGALKVAPGVPIPFYATLTGGAVVTDYLVDLTGDGTFTITSEIISLGTGYLPVFQGPDAIEDLYYDPVPGDSDVRRVRLRAYDIAASAVPAATETVAGLARRATQVEVDAGATDVPFVTPLKLAATTIFLRAKSALVTLTGATETATTYTVGDDGSTQTGWPDRLSFLWGAVKTGRFDRYGQLVAGAAKASTVPLRVENLNVSPTANLVEAGVTGALTSFVVRPNGTVVAPNVGSAVKVLGATDPVPAGTLDLTLIARLAAGGTVAPGGGGGGLLLKDHPHEGTAGTAPTASAEGYTSASGAASVYVTGGIVGSTAVRFEASVGGNLSDTFTAQDGDLYVRFYFRSDSGTTVTTPLWLPGISTEIRVRASDIVCTDTVPGTPLNSSPTITKPALGVWWRGLWQIGTTTANLQVWNTPSSTGAADSSTTLTYGAPKARPTSLSVGQKGVTGSQLSLDAIAVGTSPIGPVI